MSFVDFPEVVVADFVFSGVFPFGCAGWLALVVDTAVFITDSAGFLVATVGSAFFCVSSDFSSFDVSFVESSDFVEVELFFSS